MSERHLSWWRQAAREHPDKGLTRKLLAANAATPPALVCWEWRTHPGRLAAVVHGLGLDTAEAMDRLRAELRGIVSEALETRDRFLAADIWIDPIQPTGDAPALAHSVDDRRHQLNAAASACLAEADVTVYVAALEGFLHEAGLDAQTEVVPLLAEVGRQIKTVWSWDQIEHAHPGVSPWAEEG